MISQSSAASSVDTHTAGTPIRLHTELWETRYNLHLQKARAGGIDVLFIGDSITQYWTDERRGLKVWEEEFQPLNAANFGIAGNRTQHILWRLQNGEAEGFTPKVVVLLVGTNNAAFEDDETTPRNRIEDIVEAIGMIVAEARARFPEAKILLQALLPRGKAGSAIRERVKQINHCIQKLQDHDQVHYLDIGAAFLDEAGEIPEDVMPDALHPNEKGYRIYAEAVKPMVLKLLKQESLP